MCIKVLLEEPNHKLASWMLRMLPEGDTGPDVLLSVLRTMDANPEMGATLPVYDPKAGTKQMQAFIADALKRIAANAGVLAWPQPLQCPESHWLMAPTRPGTAHPSEQLSPTQARFQPLATLNQSDLPCNV